MSVVRRISRSEAQIDRCRAEGNAILGLVISMLLGVAVLAYLGLFVLARSAAALRLHRLGFILLALLALRMSAEAVVAKKMTSAEIIVLGAVLALAIALSTARRVWVFRVRQETLLERIRDACRRLFLTCEEPVAGHLVLKTKSEIRHLRWFSLGKRFLLVVLPRRSGRGKVELLLDWLAKQYPGPIPRIQIVLTESKS